MVGNNPAFFLAHDAVFLLFTHQNLFHCLVQVFLADQVSSLFDGVDCRLVNHIGKIGTYRTAGCQCNGIQIHGLIHFYIFCMDFQNLHTTL